METNYFERLSKVNVNGHTEEKNGLTYLSWAWAWSELKKADPLAQYTVYEDANGRFYHTDGRTCWVKTGVTVGGLEHIEYLPVMNNRNQSIPLESVTSFDVNKAIQRSLTKAAARHGLGLYIYAGEDLPEGEEKPTEEQIYQQNKAAAAAWMLAHPVETTKTLESFNVSMMDDMSRDMWERVIAGLKRRKIIA